MTAALPIEYGTVQACSYLAGVLFFQEYKVMAIWQLVVGFSGLAIIMVGVGVSALKPPNAAAAAHRDGKASRARRWRRGRSSAGRDATEPEQSVPVRSLARGDSGEAITQHV